MLAMFSLAACQRDKISVYKAPKEAPAAAAVHTADDGHNHPPANVPAGEGLPPGHPPVEGMGDMGGGLPPGHPPIDGSAPMPGSMGMGMADASGLPAAAQGGVTWTVPKGWTEKPPSQMRMGSFSAAGKNGQAVDISVVSLSGEAGGDLSNVNRWRGQIELPPITADALAKETKRISPSGRKMLLADMVSDKPVIDNKFKRRLVAAIHTSGGQTLFFKMVGEDNAVADTMPAFMKFLESLKFAK